MNLTGGTLVYPKLSVAEFIAESATWATGLCGVICDDASQAYSDLSLNLTEYNALLSRSLSVYDYDSDELNYYRIEPESFPFNFDRIHREQWRRYWVFIGYGTSHPSTNTPGAINMSYLKSKHLADSSFGVGFLTLPSYIEEVDIYASQIAHNYTYATGSKSDSGHKNFWMKRTSNIYYVYDQDEDFFYRFQ